MRQLPQSDGWRAAGGHLSYSGLPHGWGEEGRIPVAQSQILTGRSEEYEKGFTPSAKGYYCYRNQIEKCSDSELMCSFSLF